MPPADDTSGHGILRNCAVCVHWDRCRAREASVYALSASFPRLTSSHAVLPRHHLYRALAGVCDAYETSARPDPRAELREVPA